VQRVAEAVVIGFYLNSFSTIKIDRRCAALSRLTIRPLMLRLLVLHADTIRVCVPHIDISVLSPSFTTLRILGETRVTVNQIGVSSNFEDENNLLL
jgi:hypothetical protein